MEWMTLSGYVAFIVANVFLLIALKKANKLVRDAKFKIAQLEDAIKIENAKKSKRYYKSKPKQNEQTSNQEVK